MLQKKKKKIAVLQQRFLERFAVAFISSSFRIVAQDVLIEMLVHRGRIHGIVGSRADSRVKIDELVEKELAIKRAMHDAPSR